MPTSWVERIFEVMSGKYGARFADAWGSVSPEVAKREWARELAKIKPEQIALGLANLDKLEKPQFPPTAPEFVAHCRRQTVPQAHRAYLSAPRLTPEQREKGKQKFAELKRSLGWV